MATSTATSTQITSPTTSIPLPAPFTTSSTPLELITQGAEALVYRTTFLTPTTHCALKFRPSKPYRHPTLDKRLTRARILAEARVLVRCQKEGVCVPGVLGLDWEAGWVALEWVGGVTVKEGLRGWYRRIKERSQSGVEAEEPEGSGGEIADLMARIGTAIGRLHAVGIVHGDLTTSNLMLRRMDTGTDEQEDSEVKSLDGEIVLIDFGLAGQSIQEEDKAVDLYVLERAFGSTHPEAEEAFKDVLKAYGESYKGAKVVLKRLEDVRMRGRKKSMLG